MANAPAIDGAQAEDDNITAAAEEVLFGLSLTKAGWAEWGGDVAFPLEAWVKTKAKMPSLLDTMERLPDSGVFKQDGFGKEPYKAYAAQVLERLAVMWFDDTGPNGGADSKQFSHAQRNWWCEQLQEGHIFTPNYENEEFLTVAGSKIPYKERATDDPYYLRFSAYVVNTRKKQQRYANIDCRRLQSRKQLTVGGYS